MRALRSEYLELAALTADEGFTERNADTLKGVRTHRWFPQPLVCGSHILVGEATVAYALWRRETHLLCTLVEGSHDSRVAAREMDCALGHADSVMAFVRVVAFDIQQNEPPVYSAQKRQVKPYVLARKRVAAWIGTEDNALACLERRMRKRQIIVQSDQRREWKLELFGFQAAPGLEERAKAVYDSLRSTDAILRRATGELSSVDELQRTGVMRELLDASKAMSSRARSAVPHALCPWCKSTAAVMPACAACGGHGWVPKSVFERAPRELLVNPWVAQYGELLDMRTMLRPTAQAPIPSADFGDAESYVEEEEPPL